MPRYALHFYDVVDGYSKVIPITADNHYKAFEKGMESLRNDIQGFHPTDMH